MNIRFIYVYRDKATGKHVYVGSAFDAEKRDAQHSNGDCLLFDREIARRGRDAFTLEIVEGFRTATAEEMWRLSPIRENHWMDVLGTFCTEGCFNRARAFVNFSSNERFQAWCAANKANGNNCVHKNPAWVAAMKAEAAKRRQPLPLRTVVRLYEKGSSLRSIAQRFETTPAIVRSRLLEEGVYLGKTHPSELEARRRRERRKNALTHRRKRASRWCQSTRKAALQEALRNDACLKTQHDMIKDGCRDRQIRKWYRQALTRAAGIMRLRIVNVERQQRVFARLRLEMLLCNALAPENRYVLRPAETWKTKEQRMQEVTA